MRAEAAIKWAEGCDRTNRGCQVPQITKVLTEDIPTLLAEVERLTAERDAAVGDFADFLVENENSIRLAYDTQDRDYLEVTIRQWRGTKGAE